MRKSQLKRLKRDAEKTWAELVDARKRPSAIRNRFEELPELIESTKAELVRLQDREEKAFDKLTKPLTEYAHVGADYSTEKALVAHAVRQRRRMCQKYLEDIRIELAKGPEGKLAEAGQKIEDLELEFQTHETALCQYAVYYARERSDVDLVWTSEDEGQWTLEGTVAGKFNGEARKFGMKKLILYLLEPHAHRQTKDSDDKVREIKTRRVAKQTYRIPSKDLYKAMTGLPTNAYVDLAGCTVRVRDLRKYLRLSGPFIELTLGKTWKDEDGGIFYEETEDGQKINFREKVVTRTLPDGFRSHRATWKNIHISQGKLAIIDSKMPEGHIRIVDA